MQISFCNFHIESIKNWAICWRFLVYTFENENQEGILRIIDLENKNATINVKNFGCEPDGTQFYSYLNFFM